ncbi:MAG: diacylglycerol kinase family lipid kinase [Lachnospiraceae bacterium]|nr:diacylglycerol kinase family lipid kinase [Lachnospiraceae bacterium]
MTRRMLLIYNPKAGKGVFLQYLSEIIDLFTKAGFLVEVYPTQASGDAVKKIERLQDEYCMIVPAGGDGTLDEVVTGLLRSGRKIPIGYIPVGSTNDYASSLGLPTNPLEAAGNIIGGKPYRFDAGIVNENHMFIYVAAFGAFTEVAYQTNQDMKNALGHLAYLIEATKRLGDLKSYPLKVTTSGESKEGNYIFGMVTNSISVGGIKNITGKDVELDDGLFEVTLVHNPKNLLEMREIVGCLLTSNYDTDLIDFFRTDWIEMVGPQEIPWTFDGEYGGSFSQVHIEDRMKAVSMIIDRS